MNNQKGARARTRIQSTKTTKRSIKRRFYEYIRKFFKTENWKEKHKAIPTIKLSNGNKIKAKS